MNKSWHALVDGEGYIKVPSDWKPDEKLVEAIKNMKRPANIPANPSQERKNTPVFSGVMMYFPDALALLQTVLERASPSAETALKMFQDNVKVVNNKE